MQVHVKQILFFMPFKKWNYSWHIAFQDQERVFLTTNTLEISNVTEVVYKNFFLFLSNRLVCNISSMCGLLNEKKIFFSSTVIVIRKEIWLLKTCFELYFGILYSSILLELCHFLPKKCKSWALVFLLTILGKNGPKRFQESNNS